MFLHYLLSVAVALAPQSRRILVADSVHSHGRWPVVAPLDTVIHAPSLTQKALLRVAVRDQRGRLAYTLVCRSGTTPDAQESDWDNALWVPGVVLCRMNTGRREARSTILIRDESPLWYTEGWVWYSDLKDPARRRRVFRLRGFELVLTFENVVIERDEPVRLDLRVRLRPDRRITSGVMEGQGPRMCRNWRDSSRLGSWEPCAEP